MKERDGLVEEVWNFLDQGEEKLDVLTDDLDIDGRDKLLRKESSLNWSLVFALNHLDVLAGHHQRGLKTSEKAKSEVLDVLRHRLSIG